MNTPSELIFDNAMDAYNAFWILAEGIVGDTRFGDFDNWLLTCKHGLEGMMARIIAVDREYIELYKFQSEFSPDRNPNEWGLYCESYVGTAFFAMDSALECLVFALNAFGYAKSKSESKSEFRDITDARALAKISPKDILGPNILPGYQTYFPRTIAFLAAHKPLLDLLVSYHDVSKHRCSVASGGNVGVLHLVDNPKGTFLGPSNTDFTFQSLAQEFQQFIDAVLPIALEETSTMFGWTATLKQSPKSTLRQLQMVKRRK